MSLRERGKLRWLLVAGSLLGMITALIGLSGWPAWAASSVNIVSQSIACSGATVTYSVGGSTGEDYALIIVLAGDTGIAYGTGPGTPDGTYTASVAIDPPQPDGTALHLEVTVGAASAQSAVVNCGSGGASGEGGGSSGGWSGSTDGRLNPDPAEYYSVWCQYDRIDVWRAVPDSQLVESIPLIDVLNLADGGSTTAGSLTVNRAGDIVTVYGSNGNHAPEPGSKSFSLSECVARNGGPPVVVPVAAPQAIVQDQPPTAAFDVEQAFTSRIIHLLDQSTGTINAWSWTFGDGGSSNDQNPSHIYTESAIYTVTLTVTGPGGTSTASADVLVAIDPQDTESEAPLAALTFTMIPVSVDGEPSFAFYFEDASIGDVETWEWRIDGRQFSEQQNPSEPYYRSFADMLLGGPLSVSLTISGPGGSDTASAPFGVIVCPGIGFALVLGPGAAYLARIKKKRQREPGRSHEKD